jgi:peptidoglycan hydrolase CwlO-like protein
VTGPIGEPPLDALPPDAPATVEDVRSTRRWTWVAFAWAIAASVIAVLALIQAGKDDNNSTSTQTTTSSQQVPPEVQSFVKQTNDRLDAFSRRLNDTAAQADVDKLDKRVTQVENDASQAKDDTSKNGDDITQLQSDVKDLQQRVSDLEQQQQDQQGQSTTTTP